MRATSGEAAEMDDAQIIQLVLGGHRDAFHALVKKHQDKLYDLAFRMTGDRPESEDIVQAAFIRIYEKLESYDPAHKFSNWAFTIALNIARNALRRKAALKFFSLENWLSRPGDDNPPNSDPPDSRNGPEADCHNGELLAELEKSLRKLPPGLREAFILRHFQHDEIEDIAKKLEITKNLVNVRLHRAREILYGMLTEKFPHMAAPSNHAEMGREVGL